VKGGFEWLGDAVRAAQKLSISEQTLLTGGCFYINNIIASLKKPKTNKKQLL
jgi:hypothetical protein